MMLEPTTPFVADERRSGTQEMIKELLNERQSMLVLFCRVAGLHPFNHEKSIRDELREFCQVLVDYTALTHFEIYERIVEGKERRRNVIEVAEAVHPQIVELTTLIIAFNDKYDESDHELILRDLEQDLSDLGVVLASRVELEDLIIRAMQD